MGWLLVDCGVLYFTLFSLFFQNVKSLSVEFEADALVKTGVSTCGGIDINKTNHESVVCHVLHDGHASYPDYWFVSPDDTASVVLTYNSPGNYSVELNCSDGNNDTDNKMIDVMVYETVTGLTVENLENEHVYLALNPNSDGAELRFRLETGWPLETSVHLNTASLDSSRVDVNMTSREGVVLLSDIGDNVVELNVSNEWSSVSKTFNITITEEISSLWLNIPANSLINTAVLISAYATSGSDLQYEFCIEEPGMAPNSSNSCIQTGEMPLLNYTFTTTGVANVTLKATNRVSEKTDQSQIQIYNPIEGFKLEASNKKASPTENVQFTLIAPGEQQYPMGDLILMYLKDNQTLTQGEYLRLGPGESHTMNTTLSPPGNITVRAMIVGLHSSLNVSVQIPVGDPIDVDLSVAGNPWRSDKPLTVTVSDVIGWGFNYELLFGDGESIVSPPNILSKRFNESLRFKHTYARDEAFTIVFKANNAAHKQEVLTQVRILHPVPLFTINPTPAITIPDGWGSFTLNIPEGTPKPTAVDCSINFGDGNSAAKTVDWTTGFPASHKYQSLGKYNVSISCVNEISSHIDSVLVEVHDRDVDIHGLRIAMPEFCFVGVPIDIVISIDTGSNVRYRVAIGSDYDEVVTDQRYASRWELKHTFKTTGTVGVTVTATNAVGEVETSASTSVINKVTGFRLSVFPSIASTNDDIALIVHSPSSDKFPMGPLTIDFLRETEPLSFVDVPSPSADKTIEFTASRWLSGSYRVTAVVKSPIGKMEVETSVVVENPVPFFIFEVEKIITIPDGVVDYSIVTRTDEISPTDAFCVVSFGDGEEEELMWDYILSLNHTFYKSGYYNASVLCKNRVSQRYVSRRFDVCEFTADGFRFVYPLVVPKNSSSPTVNVRFKYNICGLTSVFTDAKMTWQFESDNNVEPETTIDWEVEHVFRKRGTYDVKVYIKSLKTRTETMVALPLRIGILTLRSNRTVGAVGRDVFSLSAAGAFGDKVNFVLDFGDRKKITSNRTALIESESVVFTKIYDTSGIFRPRVLAWNREFVEEIISDEEFVVQHSVGNFYVRIEQETWRPPLLLSFTIDLRKDLSPRHVSCILEPGDDSTETITFNAAVMAHNSLRLVHTYQSYGPFDVKANCSNLVSNRVQTGRIRLKTSSSDGSAVLSNLPVFLSCLLTCLTLH